MKVVLFCGGLGSRLGEYSETVPKPMVNIGYRPIMWHLMRYYAYYGHKEFILCLGYKGDYIKRYFLEYNECLSNDFTFERGGRDIHLYNHDIDDWKITFVDTGINANLGQRLMAVRKYLDGDDEFMANYSDGLSDLNLNTYLDNFHKKEKLASFLCVRPSQSFHLVNFDEDENVNELVPVGESEIWINGGFFVFKKEIFNYMKEGEELVQEPFCRLIAERQVIGFKNPSFWACIDTMKEKKMFDDMYATGNTPWMIWNQKDNQKKTNVVYGSTIG
jgi:glucose-1-phosphate cytidylyltransferase